MIESIKFITKKSKTLFFGVLKQNINLNTNTFVQHGTPGT